jgi:hypothetical protein
MNDRLPWDITAADADADADTDGTKTAPATGTQIVRRLIVVMLLTAAALDLTPVRSRLSRSPASGGDRGAGGRRAGRGTTPQIPACWIGEPRGDLVRNRARPRPLHPTGRSPGGRW